jgi:hypothetical protein
VSFWYKDAPGNPSTTCRLLLWDSFNGDTKLTSGDLTPTSTWKFFDGFSEVMNTDMTSLRVLIYPDRAGNNDAILVDQLSIQVVPEIIDDLNTDNWVGDEAIVLERYSHTAAAHVVVQQTAFGVIQSIQFDVPASGWVGKSVELEYTGLQGGVSIKSRVRRYHNGVFSTQLSIANLNYSVSGVIISNFVEDAITAAAGTTVKYEWQGNTGNNPNVTVQDRGLRLRVFNK